MKDKTISKPHTIHLPTIFKNNIFVRILLIISGIQWRGLAMEDTQKLDNFLNLKRNRQGHLWSSVQSQRQNNWSIFGSEKIQKWEITIFCVKLGINVLSIQVRSGIGFKKVLEITIKLKYTVKYHPQED